MHYIRRTQEIPDVSREAQLRSVEASFEAANANFNFSSLRHPMKPHLTAVDSFEVLPDADIWANAYDLFRFSERPGERPAEVCALLVSDQEDGSHRLADMQVDDPRLDCAIMRPMESDGDHFLAYYLTKEDEDAEKFKESRLVSGIEALEDEDDVRLLHYISTISFNLNILFS